MSEKNLIIEKTANGLGKITLNRIEVHNAFDDKYIEQLTLAIKKLEQDSSVQIIVLAAAGKSFSAGADLNWMKRSANYNQEQNYQDAMQLAQLMHTLYSCKKLTLAIVQGNAFGGGVGLIACCDIVLASEQAKFCFSEVKLGLIPAVISPYIIKTIGARHSRRYFASGELFDATKAKQIQLIHEVFASNELQQKEGIKAFLEKRSANWNKH